MIIDDKIKIKIYSNTLNYYRQKGYNCNVNDIIEIFINDLPKQSTTIINAKCDVCGKELKVKYNKYKNNESNKGFYVCSSSCAQEKIKLTKLENHGEQNFSGIEKRKNTCKEKYGNETYTNIEKRKQTNIEKYGNEHVINNIDIKNKRTQTYIDKYNENHPMKNKNIVDKKQQTCLDLYGSKSYNNIEKILETTKSSLLNNIKDKFKLDVIDYKDKLYEITCNNGHNYKINYDLIYKRNEQHVKICTICNPIGLHNSEKEKSLYEFIKENYNGKILENSRNIIKPYELDIYLPELNLAFEYNGLYWHSEVYKDKNYHINKTIKCEQQNIQLIHIWEDDWINKQEIVKSIILNKLGKIYNKLHARKCILKEINDNKIIIDFLNENHIQGYTSSTIKIGLYHNEELVSLMTFIKNDKGYELNRFCNKINTIINGAASKLFNYFIKNFDFIEIKSFADKSISKGNIYEKLKFNKVCELKPDYKYILDNIRIH